jgi:diguanylate cyclase (GGDEF)-like protein/PAS domain S-box-containing protein
MYTQYLSFLVGLLLGLLVLLLRERSNALARAAVKEAVVVEVPPPPPLLPETPAFRLFFEAISGGAATLDGNGKFTDANGSLLDRLGYEHGELCGRSLTSIVHPEDIAAVRDFFSAVSDVRLDDCHRPRFARELRCFTKSGAKLWVHLALSLLCDGASGLGKRDEPLTILALLDDVTRRREAEGAAARLSAGVHDLYQVVADQRADFASQMKALLSLGRRLFDVETGFLGRLEGERLEIIAVDSPDLRLRRGGYCDLDDFVPPSGIALAAPVATASGAEVSNTSASHLALPHDHAAPSGAVATAAIEAAAEATVEAEAGAAAVRDWRSHPFVAMTQNETFLGAPVYIAGRLYGLLYFSDAEPRATPFESEHTQFCQLMALWIGSEIERRDHQAAREKEDASLVEANSKLEAIATEDALTGVKNRRAFDNHIDAEFRRAHHHRTPLSLLLLDVDKFKLYNDSFGHPAGDIVLKKVGRILKQSVRDGVFVARYGGEEFVVLLSDTSAADALTAAERLRANIESATWPQRAVTASFGAATSHQAMLSPAHLIAAADAALYRSKASGRNRVTVAADPAAPGSGAEDGTRAEDGTEPTS